MLKISFSSYIIFVLKFLTTKSQRTRIIKISVKFKNVSFMRENKVVYEERHINLYDWTLNS